LRLHQRGEMLQSVIQLCQHRVAAAFLAAPIQAAPVGRADW
jgi:hypothetical protein